MLEVFITCKTPDGDGGGDERSRRKGRNLHAGVTRAPETRTSDRREEL